MVCAMNNLSSSKNEFSRRSFIKNGLMATGALSTPTLLSSCALSPSALPKISQLKVLRPKDVNILQAVMPRVLAKNFDDSSHRKNTRDNKQLALLISQLDEFLFRSSEFNHQALHELFDVLDITPTRIALTGLWSDWSEASDEDIDSFLEGWRDSSFNLLRMGYCQLTQLTAIVYYSQPENWNKQIYPGPPQHLPA